MAINFVSTISKSLFIGRQEELEQFSRVINGERSEWIVHIPAPGGSGKTRLLERFREEVLRREKMLITGDLVDFYNASNQTGFGLLQEIARQLGREKFSAFEAEREEFTKILQGEPEPDERQDAANQVTQAFLRDYRQIRRQGYHVVLLFDTCEELHGVRSFFLNTLLAEIAKLEQELSEELTEEGKGMLLFGSTVVIAGRVQLDFPPQYQDRVLALELAPLNSEEVVEFFKEGGLVDIVKNKRTVTKLHALTGGRPLYVALSFDWLKNEVGTLDELLALEEPFGPKLVSWIRRLQNLEEKAILYSALAWRRMEPSLLARLLAISDEEAQGVIEGLSRFSFSKYRKPSEGFRGAFQLHDEMRHLVLQHISPLDGHLTQADLLKQIVEWYEIRIGKADLLKGEELPDTDEGRALLAEWLYYQGQIDLRKAFDAYELLFRKSSHYMDLAFSDLLNEEIKRFRGMLNAEQQNVLRFREALAAFRREQFEEANQIWYSLLRRSDLKDTLRATTLMLLVESKSFVQPDEAIERAIEGEKLYSRLIANEVDSMRREQLKHELGSLYNNWGIAYRVKGDQQKALEFYQKALEYYSRDKNIARTYNNMGFIYLQLGDIVQAKTYVGRALQMRRELKISYELGLGYNTMGIIMEQSGRMDDAADLYRKALLSFEAARSERGQALVWMNLGRIDRLTNRFDEAFEYLQRARQVFADKKDRDHLVEALNELGCTYRQRGREEDDWKRSEALLKESLELSETLGRISAQVDNLEDLGILYSRWAHVMRREDLKKADLLEKLVYENTDIVKKLAEEQGYIYLFAKNERTLGDLEYGKERYKEAFEHYFKACRLMARARREGNLPIVQLQRRYEEMVDRLQEQLQALPEMTASKSFAQTLLAQLMSMETDEQQNLELVQKFLIATIELSQGRESIVKP